MHSHRRLVSLIIGVGTLSVAAVAVAAIVSGNSTTGASSHVTYTQLTLPVPTESTGDVMVASIAIKGGTATVMVTVPSGWTQIARTDNDTNVTLISYYKVAGTSEPSNYTWTIQDQTRAEGGITDYSGVDASNPIDTFAGNIGRGRIATTSPITTTKSQDQIIALFSTDVGTTSASGYFLAPTTTSMSQKYNVSNAALGPSIASHDAQLGSAGSAGSISSATGDNKVRDWATQVIALRASGITFDNAAHSTAVGTNTGTLSFTTSGSNRILLVSVTNDNISGSPSVTYDDVALTEGIDFKSAAVWYLINPPTGTHDIVVTSTTSNAFTIMATSLNGVDQTTGIGATGVGGDQFNSVSSSSVTVATTHANSWIVDATRINGIRDASATGINQTIRNVAPIPTPPHIEQGEQSTQTTSSTGNYTLGYSWSGPVDYLAAAVEVLPAN